MEVLLRYHELHVLGMDLVMQAFEDIGLLLW